MYSAITRLHLLSHLQGAKELASRHHDTREIAILILNKVDLMAKMFSFPLLVEIGTWELHEQIPLIFEYITIESVASISAAILFSPVKLFPNST